MILLEVDATLATITLNRPERHNSLTPALLERLLAALAEVKAQPAVRAVVLQANGRSFSTGGDLQGFADHLEDIQDYARQIVGLLNQTMLAMIDLPVPIIAAVQGVVTGGSLGLVLAADLVLVTSQASFMPYYSIVGFSPDGGWTALLPEIIGQKRATDLLLTNGTLSAQQALTYGLASRLSSAEDVHREARELAFSVAAMHPGAVQRIKRRLWADLPIAQRLEDERQHFVEQIGTSETQASMLAFLSNLKR